MGKQEEAIKLVNDLSTQIVDIANEVKKSHDKQSGSEKMRRWKDRASRKIAAEINEIEGQKLKKKRKGSFRMNDPIGNFMDEVSMYLGFLKALEDEITNYPDDVLERATLVKPDIAEEVITPKVETINNCIFIVHGHDELNLLRTKELLRDRWALEPVVLSGRPGKGRTIIEKFEEEAQRASFAFILLTPDDIIQKDEKEYSQARPNVTFELGWFYGRLGRERVCILFKEGTNIHSDLEGVSRIQFKESIAEVMVEIEAELIEAGVLNK